METQKNLNTEAARHAARDAELEELKQLCIATQANLNKSLDTPEGKKDGAQNDNVDGCNHAPVPSSLCTVAFRSL